MREITKTLTMPVDGRKTDFRLTKLDAFSGVSLLRMLSKVTEATDSVLPGESEGSNSQFPALLLFTALSDADLRSLMTVCLEHCEVLLPAGWNPVMTRGEWSWIELEHDVATCLKLTIEEVLRRGLGLTARDPGFLIAECPNVDEFAFLPVMAGMWRQHELWDGTYTLDDLLDAVELIRVRRENEQRALETMNHG